MTEITHDQGPLWQIGQRLKSVREEKKMTLNQVAETTRISLSLLRGIEEGYVENNPGEVFIRGFIRTYAKLLAIPEEELKEPLEELYQNHQAASVEPLQKHSMAMRQNDAEVQSKALLLAAGVIIVVLGYLVISQLSGDGDNAPTASGNHSQQEVSQQSTEPSESSLAAADTTLSAAQKPLTLSIRSLESTWIGVAIDGDTPFEIHMQPGEELEWKANDQYQLSIGNTRGVQVYLNAELLAVNEERDLLLNWTIDKSSLGQ